MRIKTKKMAGMVMCVLSVVATSSCSKEDFFGLNEYETLDYSKKTEIALSQEYTDYFTACIEVGEIIRQRADSLDSTKGAPNNYTGESLIKLLGKLRATYPELNNADRPDYEDIRKIALLKNKALKALAQKKTPSTNTRSFEYYAGNYGKQSFDLDAEACISYMTYATGGSPYNSGCLFGNNYAIYACYSLNDAVDCILSLTWENGNCNNATACGGLLFSNSALAIIKSGEEWPSVLNYIPITPEKDFYFVNVTAGTLTQGQIAYLEASYGPGQHVLLDLNGEVIN